MRKRVLGLGGLVLIGAVFGWWRWTRVTPPVTEAEARAYLNRIAAAARSRDFDQVCRLNLSQNQCRFTLDEFDLRESAPTEPPIIVGTRYVREEDGHGAGRVVVVEGTTSCGQKYHTEVMVFRESRFHFKAINSVFWSNAQIFKDNTRTPIGDPPPTCP